MGSQQYLPLYYYIRTVSQSCVKLFCIQMIRKVYDQYNELYPIKNVNTMFVYVCLLAPSSLSYSIWISSHLKLCIATAIRNFKWLKM